MSKRNELIDKIVKEEKKEAMLKKELAISTLKILSLEYEVALMSVIERARDINKIVFDKNNTISKDNIEFIRRETLTLRTSADALFDTLELADYSIDEIEQVEIQAKQESRE